MVNDNFTIWFKDSVYRNHHYTVNGVFLYEKVHVHYEYRLHQLCIARIKMSRQGP